MIALPAVADEIVRLYLQEIDNALPGFLKGFYIYGSIALDDFHPHKSDIDFIAVVEAPPDKNQITLLNRIHKSVQRKYRKPNMNGMYITFNSLGKSKKEVKPYPYFFEGKMFASSYMELNKITWYQLQHYGIAVRGPLPEELNIHISIDELKKEMQENINTYWKVWVKKHSGFSISSLALLLVKRKVEWGVLGVARQYYTILTGRVTSKAKAGKFCLDNTDKRFTPILREAVNTREGKPTVYTSLFKRKRDTLAYMHYIIEQINSFK